MLRALALLLTIVANSCAAEPEGPTPGEVHAAALADFERTLAETIRRADEAADAVARTLEPIAGDDHGRGGRAPPLPERRARRACAGAGREGGRP